MNLTIEISPVSRFQLPLPPVSVLQNTLGAILISGIVTAVLYGISCLQCFIFFQSPVKRQLRLLFHSVWVIWILDTAHIAVFDCYTLYWYMIKNYGNTLSLLELPWSVPAGIIITAVSDGLVRFCFSYRVWILSNRNKWLTYPLLFFQLILWGVALATGIRGLSYQTIPTFLEISWLLYFALSFIILTDFYIAISLCFFLYRSRRDIISRRTESLINLLIIYTINTGLLTSIVAVITLVLCIAQPHNYGYMGIYFVLEKLYVNSLLASLNVRDWLQNDSHAISLPLGSIGKRNSTRAISASVSTGTHASELSTSEAGSGVCFHIKETTAVA